jgi:hypothetical protein
VHHHNHFLSQIDVNYSQLTMSESEQEAALPDYLVKQLLQDVEKSGETLEDFKFLLLCDKLPQNYGGKGTPLRRKFQKKYSRLKEKKAKSFEAYLQVLAGHSVPPGIATQLQQQQVRHQQQQALKQQEALQKQRLLKQEALQQQQEALKQQQQALLKATPQVIMSADDDLAASFEHLSMGHRSTTAPPSAAHTPVRSAVSSSVYTPSNRPPFASTPTTIYTPDQSTSRAPSFDAVSTMPLPPTYTPYYATLYASIESAKTQHGTKGCPYVIAVDLTHPERNQGMFYIEKVPGVDQKGYTRTALNIRVNVPVCDIDHWEATIPNGYPDDLAQRLVLIKGPSQNFWFSNTDRYHTKLTCAVTKHAHKATDLEIQEDPSRQHAYWLLVFPEGTHLDNGIFSSDGNNVDARWNDMASDEKSNIAGKLLYGMAIYWNIGVTGGRRIAVTNAKADFSTMFKKK